MNWLTKKKEAGTELESFADVDTMNLDQLFELAQKYGAVHLWQNDDGRWAMRLALPTSNPAIKAEVMNKGYARTPHAAIIDCLQRLNGG